MKVFLKFKLLLLIARISTNFHFLKGRTVPYPKMLKPKKICARIINLHKTRSSNIPHNKASNKPRIYCQKEINKTKTQTNYHHSH